MRVLGIESSCDETGMAIYDTEQGLLAHALHSQVALHAEYGGVVPEIASRDHIQQALPLLQEVLNKSQLNCSEINAIAYTAGPGLAGALLVGAGIAHGLAFSLNKPIILIHHLEGHILSPLLGEQKPSFPFIALLISGGHTQLLKVDDIGQYSLLGETLDDAAGEAFDKTAQLLGLGYPGGAALSQLAKKGSSGYFTLPRPMLHSGTLDFSFSGLKTAVSVQIQKLKATNHFNQTNCANLAHDFVNAIVDVLISKTLFALKKTKIKQLVVAGGVSANEQLRTALDVAASQNKANVLFPDLKFCTDNGAMIALAGALRIKRWPEQALKNHHFIKIRPRWPLNMI